MNSAAESNELANDLLRNIIERDPVLRQLFTRREARWRYFHVGRTLDVPPKRGFPAFAWTTERVDGKFISWVWTPDGDNWRRTRDARHSTRKAAKARALRLRNQYKSRREESKG